MPRKNFNWNYKTPHILAQSRVADHKMEHFATFTQTPCELDKPITPKPVRTADEDEAIAKGGLLSNTYA